MNDLPMEMVEKAIYSYPIKQKIINKNIKQYGEYTEYTITWRLYHVQSIGGTYHEINAS
jgi:hypothetical protein